jgi:FkbM family methyltransferase
MASTKPRRSASETQAQVKRKQTEGEIDRVVNGDVLRLVPEFAHAEPLGAEWEAALYERFKETLRPGMTVLDVGASFGLFSIAAARVVGPAGRVFAFEPAAATAAALATHLHLNGVAERVELVPAAVAEASGRATFWERSTSFQASLVELAPRLDEHLLDHPIEERPVRTVALDDFCRDRGVEPEVVKIDVEGAEAGVLRGARGLLRRRAATIFLEVHHDLLERIEGSADGVFGELEAAGWSWDQVGERPGAGPSHYVCSP